MRKVSDVVDCLFFNHQWKAYDQGLKFCDHCGKFERLDGYEGQRIMQAVWWILILLSVAAIVITGLFCAANS